ncbi:hypothetical protein N0V85_001975, partial [Neurospora sp. IMI 360204]
WRSPPSFQGHSCRCTVQPAVPSHSRRPGSPHPHHREEPFGRKTTYRHPGRSAHRSRDATAQDQGRRRRLEAPGRRARGRAQGAQGQAPGGQSVEPAAGRGRAEEAGGRRAGATAPRGEDAEPGVGQEEEEGEPELFL